MDWGKLLQDWGPLILASIPNIVLAAQWAMRKEFATTDSLVSVHKVLDDQARENREAIVRAHHRIDLLDKDIKGLPTYDITNRLKEGQAELSRSFEGVKMELRGIDDRTRNTDDAVTRIEQHLLNKAG